MTRPHPHSVPALGAFTARCYGKGAVSAISRKNQVTIPKQVLEAAGLAPGDDVRITSAGPGRVELVKTEDLIDEFAGALDNRAYPPGYLDDVRRGWE